MRITSGVLALGVVAMVLVACGGDDGDASPTSAVVRSDTSGSGDGSGEGFEIAGSAGDDDLLVPRDYLQGEWCDSDGQTWTIDGDTVRLEDASGGAGDFPVDIAFIDGPEETLISQTDDEFVVEYAGDEITFSRGSC
jgi:hypothetical protein